MDIFIESARHKVFSDACAKSSTGEHRVVRLFPEVPHLGCLHCRRRNRKVKLAGANLYNYMVDTMSATAEEAFRASGWLPPKSNARRRLMGPPASKEQGS